MGFGSKSNLIMRILIFILLFTLELSAQRYYSRSIFDKLIVAPPSGSTANVIAWPSGSNPTPRKYVAMGGGSSLTAHTNASAGINQAYIAKNNSNYIMAILALSGSTTYTHGSGNGGTSWQQRSVAATNYCRPAISGDGSFGMINRAASSLVGYYGTVNGTHLGNFISGASQSNAYCGVCDDSGNNCYFFRNGGTASYKFTSKTTSGTFNAPFVVSDADMCMTGSKIFCVRASGGHDIAWSNDGAANWTTITISGSTTQTTPTIRVSDDEQKIFVAFDLSNAYSSTNGGSSWTGPFTLPTGFSWTTMTATKDLSTIVACKSTSNGTFFYSTDMGATWTEKVDGAVGVAFSAIVAWD